MDDATWKLDGSSAEVLADDVPHRDVVGSRRT